MEDVVTTYYICDAEVAKEYCRGQKIKYVFYFVYDNYDRSTLYHIQLLQHNEHNAVLLANIDSDLQLVLSLKDSTFCKILREDMSYEVACTQWVIL